MTTSQLSNRTIGTGTAARPATEAQSGGRKVHVKSYGCQMNVYDAQRMIDALAPEGFAETDVIEEADLVVLNTCHIRERATEKVYSELGKLRLVERERAEAGRQTTIVVAGCVAQAEGAEILRRARAVGAVVGPQSYHRLPEIVARATKRERVVETDFPVEDKFDRLPAPAPAAIRKRGTSAFVTVQEGCDKFCTFCVVPYTRGAEASRPVSHVVADVERLAREGVREVTLLGQNVNAYHGEAEAGGACGLEHLTARLAAVPGIARIRYTTSHPRDMSAALIAAHRDQPSLMPYLHLPVQSGSDRVLAAMNRGHTADDYRRLIERVRHARPDIALSSDFIVGFPGETEADFEATLRLVEGVGFAASFSFKYSARPGTPGAEMAGHVGEPVKAERLARLQAVIEPQRQAFNRTQVGRTLDVLFEKPGRHSGQIVGKSPYLQPVHVIGPSQMIGEVGGVEIVGVGPNSLVGRLVAADIQGVAT